jgi:hypothetical protein
MTAYPGQRIADFTPYEQMGMQGMYDMAAQGAPAQVGMASDIAAQIRLSAIQHGSADSLWVSATAGAIISYSGSIPNGVPSWTYYAPGQFQTGFEAGRVSPQYQANQYYSQIGDRQFDPGYQAGVRDSQFQMGDYASGYQAAQFDPGYVARELGQDYTARDLESQYQAGSIASDPETLQQYMNPYQQLVTDIQKREAQKQSDIMGSQIEQQASQAGGLGGYREAIMQSERQRNLGEQLQDIQATGDQAAYQQALQAFEQDRAARGQQEQFRQQAFGTTEEARQAQQRMAIDSFQSGEQARQQAASFGMTAQQQEDAARQAQEQFQQQAFGQTLDARTTQEQFGQGAFEFGEQMKQFAANMGMDAQQATDASRQAQEQFMQTSYQMNQASQQAAQELNAQAYNAREQARQEASRQGLGAAEAKQQGYAG